LRQFHNVLLYMMLFASLVTALLGFWVDSAVILLAVVVNALIGFVQEGKAANALDAIRDMLSLHALVLPTLADFMQAYPDIELDLDFSDRVVDVVDEGFDVVLRTGQPVDSRLSMRELGEFQLKLVGSPAYFARHGTPRCPEDLLRHTCLHYRFPNTGRLEEWPLRCADGESPPQIPVSMVCNNIETRVCFALRDQGIACLPDFSIREALREGRLVSVLDAFCERRARFFLLWPSGRQVSPKLRAFIDFVAPRVIATLG
ncbi:LysR substrate-binding domain-containing protein, partial [Pseudomonas aeruginosa]|nr:LysR substrate-binding domain-containing protein [Pseudomonas aeruginosa]